MYELLGTKKTDFGELERFLFENIEPASSEEAEDILEALASAFFSADSDTPTAARLQSPERGAKRLVAGELPDREARYHILVEQIPAVVFMAFLDKGVGEAYVSPHIEDTIGFTREEWLNNPIRWYQQIHPEDKGRWCIDAARLFLFGEDLRAVYRVIARDGHVVWFHCEARMVHDAQGSPWFLHGVGFDITELKQAEEALKRRGEELRALTANLLSIQDEEQRRIARELHDGTAQNLAAVAMNLSLLMDAPTVAAAVEPQSRRILSDSLALVQQCVSEIRNLSYLLHPPLLDDLGLAAALKSYVEGFSQRTGIRVSLELPPKLGRLSPEVETALFRITQEGLANVHRHSGSPRASLRIALAPTEVRLELEDEGSGKIPTGDKENGQGARFGVGIPGMRERAQQLGGRMEINSNSGGTRVTVTLPLKSN
jgi:PAS domain S-box-containing protein